MKFTIEGVPVFGKNSTQIRWSRRTRKPYVSKSEAAASWQLLAIEQLTRQRTERRLSTIRGPVYVEYTAFQERDRCDVDNMEAALFDALKKAGVIEDDLFIVDHRGRKAIDAAAPRIEVEVRRSSPQETVVTVVTDKKAGTGRRNYGTISPGATSSAMHQARAR